MMGGAFFRLGLGCGLLSWSTYSVAQDALPALTISADSPAASATEPAYFTGPVHVIARDEFPVSAQTAADVLAPLAAVQVRQRGERGSGAMIQVRGAPGRHTHVYVDGIRVGSPGTDSLDLAQYDLSGVESIEVYSASSPPQFAESGIGGSINIKTRGAGTGSQFQFRQFIGSFGAARQSIRSQQAKGQWTTEVSGFWETADNDFEYIFDNGTPANPDDDRNEKRNNAAFNVSGARLGVTRRLDGALVQLRGSIARKKKDLPTWNNRDITATYYDSESADFALSFQLPELLGAAVASDSRVFGQYHTGTFVDPGGNIALTGTRTEDVSETRGFHQTFSGSLGNHYLHSVLEVRKEQFTVGGSVQKNSYERLMSTFALSDEWYSAPTQSTLQIGARLQRMHDLKPGERSAVFSACQAGLTQPLGPVTVELSYQSAYRVPALYEIYGDQGSFRGNSDLTHETSDSYDASISWSPGPLNLALGYYYRESRDAIAPVYNSQAIGRYENIGFARFNGIETDINAAFEGLGTQWQFGASGAWQQSIIDSPFKAYDGNEVPGYYPRSLRVFGQASRHGRQVRVSWNHNSGLFYDRANSTEAPVKERLNLDIRQQFTTANSVNHTVALSLNNLLDQGGQDYNRSPLPGRSYSLTYQFNQ